MSSGAVQDGGDMPHGAIVLCRISMFLFFGTFGKNFREVELAL